MTVADQERREKDLRGFQKRWQGIDRSKLSDADRINYDIFGRSLRDRITESEFKGYLMPITNREGFHTDFPQLALLDTPIRRRKAFANATGQGLSVDELVPLDAKASAELATLIVKAFPIAHTVITNGE